MTTNPALLHDYQEVLKKWEKLRYIEQVRDENPERMNTWYEQGRVVIYRIEFICLENVTAHAWPWQQISCKL
jgi:hypothetical protein